METPVSRKDISPSSSSSLTSNYLSEAQKEIAESQKIVLSDRDRDLFLSLTENPPQPNQDLIAAMQDFQQKYTD